MDRVSTCPYTVASTCAPAHSHLRAKLLESLRKNSVSTGKANKIKQNSNKDNRFSIYFLNDLSYLYLRGHTACLIRLRASFLTKERVPISLKALFLRLCPGFPSSFAAALSVFLRAFRCPLSLSIREYSRTVKVGFGLVYRITVSDHRALP